jgi:hypothetical protein
MVPSARRADGYRKAMKSNGPGIFARAAVSMAVFLAVFMAVYLAVFS